jgi:hypothetical protein
MERARLAEFAAECFQLAAGVAAGVPHDPRVHRLVDTLWLLREAAHALGTHTRDTTDVPGAATALPLRDPDARRSAHDWPSREDPRQRAA